MDIFSKESQQRILKSISEDQYIMASLEVDEIVWQDDENTPELKESEPTFKFKRVKPCEDNKVRSKKSKIENESTVEAKGDVVNCFSSLAEEIILTIFSYLPHSTIANCVLVCKQWKCLGYDSILWKNADLYRKHIEHRYLTQILHRGVKKLRLNQAEIFSTSYANCHNHSDDDGCENFPLTHLDTTNAKFGDDNILSSILSKCRFLRCLSLEGCPVGLRECLAISCNEKIEVLNLSMVSGLTLQGIDTLTKKCRVIRSLNLSWTNLSKDSIKFICRCKQLEKLNLSGMKGRMTHSIMENLLTSCPHLVEFDLSDMCLEYGILRVISKLCKNIRKLSVSRCSEITPQSLFEMTEALASLTHINIWGFTNLNMLDRMRPNILVNEETFSTIARAEVYELY